MKAHHFLIILMALTVGWFISAAYASVPLEGMNITASLSTQVVTPTSTGTTYSLHTVPVTTKSITQALFATGTTGAAKASDLALVFAGGGIAAINTSSSNAFVRTIALTGSNNTSYTLFLNGKAAGSGAILTESVVYSDFDFLLPGQATQRTGAKLSVKVRLSGTTEKISDLFITFTGGSTSGTATYFHGSARQNGKTY